MVGPVAMQIPARVETIRHDREAGYAEKLTLVEAVCSPALRLNLDLYHAQIGEANLIERVHGWRR